MAASKISKREPKVPSKDDRLPLYESDVPDLVWEKAYQKRPIPACMESSLVGLSSYRIYRYCTLPEVLGLFSRREWTFAHPRTWSDKYEHEISRALFESPAPFAFARAHLKCMSFQFASNALWKTYSSAMGVLRLSIQLGKLMEMLSESSCDVDAKIYAVRARYLEERDLRKTVAALRRKQLAKNVSRYAVPPLTLKRSGFDYENELRLCALSSNRGAPRDFITFHNLDVTKFDSILIDPYLGSWQAREVQALLTERLRVSATVRQSKFDVKVSLL